MENKLQELTEKIYSEGILKATNEGNEIKKKAKTEAGEIVKNAKKEADHIIEEANSRAEEIRMNVQAELKLSANQAISSIKQQIVNLISSKVVDEPVREAYKDVEFVKRIIESLIENWASGKTGVTGISLILPEKSRNDLGNYFTSKQHEVLKGGLDVTFDKAISSGFRIGPKDDSYLISFTDDDFSNFLRAYLRPRTTQLLYGEE